MTSIAQVSQAMQAVLTTEAEAAARGSGFVQRESKMGGASFVQTLTFGWLANPQASLSELTQTAAALGVAITPQGLENRFTPCAAALLSRVLEAALAQVITSEAAAVPLLQRFTAIYLQDSTQIQLPGALAGQWRGNGAYHVPAAASAALKLQIRLEWHSGRLEGPFLQDGRAGDRSSPTQTAPLAAGALRLADLGYFDLVRLQQVQAQGAYFLTRVMAGTHVYDELGQPLDLKRWLRRRGPSTRERSVQLGAQTRLPVRVLALRVPPAVVARRRRQLKEAARKRQHPVSPERWALAGWTIWVTNVPAERLSLPEALVVARLRWQIELVFKLWKTQGQVDTWRSRQPWRILCEVYAKLVGLVVQHWLRLTGGWARPARSWVKGAQTVRQHALHLASRMAEGSAGLCAALTILQRCLQLAGPVNTRKQHPSAFQLWLNPTLQSLA